MRRKAAMMGNERHRGATTVARYVLIAVIVIVSGGCGASLPSGPDSDYFEKLQEKVTRSADGRWSGASPTLTMTFTLAQSASGQLSGSGSMLETATSLQVPITVSGTYIRPSLVLTIDGMVYKGKTVRGTFQGQYTNFAGIDANLVMTGSDGESQISFFLSEDDKT